MTMFTRRTFLKWMAALAGSLKLGSRWQVGAQAPQHYVLPPTIHHVTESTAILYFRLAQHTSNGLVRLWAGDDLQQEIPFQITDQLRHQITLTDLAPATAYTYQVLVEGDVLPYMDEAEAWSPLQFHTQPFAFPITVAAIGDSGFGEQITYDMGLRMAEHTPDLFLHLGDIVYHMHEYDNQHFVNWQKKYFAPFAPLLKNMPHYPTFGNHDLDPPTFVDNWPSYYWVFPPINEDQHQDARMWYSFDVNGIQFLSLNSQLFYSYADLRAEQEAWLDQKLARDDVRYTVVFFHVAPFTSSAPHQWDGIYVAEQWAPKFSAAKVPLVLAGHAHVYERLQHDGVNYVTAGAGSNVIYSEGETIPQTITMWRVTSYPILKCYEDRIELTTYDMEGTILDEATFSIEL